MEAWRLVVLLSHRFPGEGADRVSVDAVCGRSNWTLELETVDEGRYSRVVVNCDSAVADLWAGVVADRI